MFQYTNLVEIIGFAMPAPMAMIMEVKPTSLRVPASVALLFFALV